MASTRNAMGRNPFGKQTHVHSSNTLKEAKTEKMESPPKTQRLRPKLIDWLLVDLPADTYLLGLKTLLLGRDARVSIPSVFRKFRSFSIFLPTLVLSSLAGNLAFENLSKAETHLGNSLGTNKTSTAKRSASATLIPSFEHVGFLYQIQLQCSVHSFSYR